MLLKSSSAIYLLHLVPEATLNTLRLRQDGWRYSDIFKCIFVYENVWVSIEILLKIVPQGPINNIPALVQIMALHQPDDKPLSEPMMVSLVTHICVTQWVKYGHLDMGSNELIVLPLIRHYWCLVELDFDACQCAYHYQSMLLIVAMSTHFWYI